jgi:hypothetical protein
MPIRQRLFQLIGSPTHALFSCKESCPRQSNGGWIAGCPYGLIIDLWVDWLIG